jgi:RNA polymerase sigma factor (sigma-70 family)
VQGRSPLRVVDPEDRVASVMAEHGRALLRTANHFSLCHDDALDAYQRALEIFLRRADRVLPETEVAWLKVVVKHEALAIRRARSEAVSGEEPDLDARTEPTARPLDEQVAGGERVSRSAEALRALKPDERRALMLKAQGYSYDEIGAHLGWTYTKVNRSITEGRRRFMKVFAAIESGEACEQYAATIAALAAGTATSADVIEIRPHLRHCAACRATVKRLHVPAGTRVKLLLPGFLLAPVAAATAAKGPPTPEELEFSGHFAAEFPERARGANLGRLRDELYALLHRTNASDAATGVSIATAQGGGRITTIATIIGFCVSGAGAGALCVATGVVQAPSWILDGSDRAPSPRPAAKAKPEPEPAPRSPARLTASSRATEVVSTPTPAPTPRPLTRKPRQRRPTASQDPSQGTTPTSHENAPISQAPPATTSEFGPESSGGNGSTTPPPTSSPATGGGEFLP